jgi:hypothetical protein
MNSSLVGFCSLIAEEGAKNAHKHTQLFVEVVQEATDRDIPRDGVKGIFKVFAFLNWAYSNGVWSNLSDTTLRRDLMSQSLMRTVLRTAQELAVDESSERLAFLAANLDQEFRRYAVMYKQRINELTREGFNANAATLCGLEWIQDVLVLDDEEMNVIVPLFNARTGDIAAIEALAKQVGRAGGDRKKGFFSRLLGL